MSTKFTRYALRLTSSYRTERHLLAMIGFLGNGQQMKVVRAWAVIGYACLTAQYELQAAKPGGWQSHVPMDVQGGSKAVTTAELRLHPSSRAVDKQLNDALKEFGASQPVTDLIRRYSVAGFNLVMERMTDRWSRNDEIMDGVFDDLVMADLINYRAAEALVDAYAAWRGHFGKAAPLPVDRTNGAAAPVVLHPEPATNYSMKSVPVEQSDNGDPPKTQIVHQGSTEVAPAPPRRNWSSLRSVAGATSTSAGSDQVASPVVNAELPDGSGS